MTLQGVEYRYKVVEQQSVEAGNFSESLPKIEGIEIQVRENPMKSR